MDDNVTDEDVETVQDGSQSSDLDSGDGRSAHACTTSRLEQDLSSKPDAAVMVRLRLRKGGTAKRQSSFTLVCCHLWYHPLRPDLKTAQCHLLFDAIRRFHEKCGVAMVSEEVTGEERCEQEESVDWRARKRGCVAETGPANLVICGDFNSIPVVQPVFLPGPLKVSG